MNFSQALDALKEQKHLRRAGWGRPGMRVYMVPPSTYEGISVGATLVLAISDESIQPGWVASMGDLFADDWQVV